MSRTHLDPMSRTPLESMSRTPLVPMSRTPFIPMSGKAIGREHFCSCLIRDTDYSMLSMENRIKIPQNKLILGEIMPWYQNTRWGVTHFLLAYIMYSTKQQFSVLFFIPHTKFTTKVCKLEIIGEMEEVMKVFHNFVWMLHENINFVHTLLTFQFIVMGEDRLVMDMWMRLGFINGHQGTPMIKSWKVSGQC